MSPQNAKQTDRRHSDRFPIERRLCYRAVNNRGGEVTGDSTTLNISSSGVLFTAGQMLLAGRRLELTISWPAQLNSKCGLKLVAQGRVVRYEHGCAALEIQQYEFRTSAVGSSALASTGTNAPALPKPRLVN